MKTPQKVYLTSSFFLFFYFGFHVESKLSSYQSYSYVYIEHALLKKAIVFVGEIFQFYALYITNAFMYQQ